MESNNSASTINGLLLVRTSIFRSPYFICATLVGIAGLVLDGYAVLLRKGALGQPALLLCAILVFFQIINLWVRLIRYQAGISEIGVDTSSNEQETLQTIKAMAVGGLAEILLWSFLLVFLLLFYVTMVAS
jgi:hypothetical protein